MTSFSFPYWPSFLLQTLQITSMIILSHETFLNCPFVEVILSSFKFPREFCLHWSNTASCNSYLWIYLISLQSALYLAGNQIQGVNEWMDRWMDRWQWMKKSKLYKAALLQQVCTSFPVGYEMEKDATPMINLTSMELSPKRSSWSFCQVSWVWRKRKWKTLCLWSSKFSPLYL